MQCIIKNCNQAPMYTSTSIMAKHLKRIHGIVPKLKQSFKPSLVDICPSISKKTLPIELSDKITTKLSLALATSSAPYRLINNPHFKEFVTSLNGSYKLPTDKTIAANVADMFSIRMKKLKQTIDEASYVSLIIDYWTGNNNLGYIGIVATYIKDRSRVNTLLAANVIILTNSILEEFGFTSGIDNSRIFSITTDNGSNMRKAYEQRNYVVDSEDSENQEIMEYDDYHESYFEDLMKSLQKRISCIDHLINNNLKNCIKKIMK